MTIIQQIRLGILDIYAGFKSYEIWLLLGWSEIKQRYRRSTIGPFWLTISMAITIAILGPLYGRLFGQATSGYITFLSIGMVLWTFINGVINDSSSGFIAAEGFIKEFNLPLSVFIYRVIWRHIIILGHNLIVVFIVLLFDWNVSIWALIALPLAIFFLLFNSLCIGLILGVICARFRDVQQIVVSFMQILFFVTPIMWQPNMLGSKSWLLNFNPMYFFMEAIRAPLLGKDISMLVWLGLISFSLIFAIAATYFFGRFRNRVAYWL